MFQALLASITFIDVIAALVVIAAMLVSLIVIYAGALYVLQFITGSIPRGQISPPRGYQYRYIDKEGRGHYGTWSKKDDYMRGRGNRL